MKTSFELVAEFRDAQGKGASRRLRHANKVPAILYGGHRDPRPLSLDHTKLLLLLGRTYVSSGRKEEGVATFEVIVQQFPQSPMAEKAKETLTNLRASRKY